MAPTGVSSGRSSSIYLSDRGGLLTRAGIAALGLVAAAGASDSKTTRTVTDQGTYLYIQEETTTTVNPERAQAAADIMNAATDPDQNFGGACAGLEIASRDLGGDTSGWMFNLGYAASATSSRSHWGVRGSAKLAFGAMTMHDRELRSYAPNSVTMTTGDASYDFFGTMLRLGLSYWLPLAHRNVAMLEGFVETDLNFMTAVDQYSDSSHPSPWSVGARFTALKYVYVETKVLWSAMNAAHTSLGLELGVAF